MGWDVRWLLSHQWYILLLLFATIRKWRWRLISFVNNLLDIRTKKINVCRFFYITFYRSYILKILKIHLSYMPEILKWADKILFFVNVLQNSFEVLFSLGYVLNHCNVCLSSWWKCTFVLMIILMIICNRCTLNVLPLNL